MELLHEAAYRDTLGMSLYLNPRRIGMHDSEMLAEFAATHFVPSNMAIVGVGMDPEELAWQMKHTWGFGKDAPVVSKVAFRLREAESGNGLME